MFCIHCGSPLPDNARFCPACGAKVELPSQPEPFPEEKAETIPAEPPVKAASEDIEEVKPSETAKPASEENTYLPPETVPGTADVIPAEEEGSAEEPAEEIAEASSEPTDEIAEHVAEASSELAAEVTEPAAEASSELAAEVTEPAAEASSELAAEVTEPAAEASSELTDEIAEPVTGTSSESDAGEAPGSEVIEPDGTLSETSQVFDGEETEEALSEETTEGFQEIEIPAPAGSEPQAVTKKKSKAPLIIALLLIAAAVGGWFIYQNLPSTKVNKHLKAAETALAAGSYSEALAEAQEVLSLDPENQDAADLYGRTYGSRISAIIEQADDMEPAVDEALKAYEQWHADLQELPGDLKKGEQKKLTDHMNALCDKLIDDGYWDEAIVIFNGKEDVIPDYEGIALDPSAQRMAEAVTDLAREYMSDGEPQDAIGLLGVASRLLPSRRELFDETAVSIYHEWTEDLLSEGDIEEIKEHRSVISAALLDLPELEEDLDRIDQHIEYYELYEQFDQLAAELAPLLDEGDKEGAAEYLYKNMVRYSGKYYTLQKEAMYGGENFPLITAAGAKGYSMGLYNGNYTSYIYYGEYDGNQRSGHGIWLCADSSLILDTDYYYAEGSWSQDKPNGDFYEYERTVPYDSDESKIVEKNAVVVNGLYDGEVEFIYNTVSSPMYGNFSAGKVEILATVDPNGKSNKVIAFSRDKRAWLSNAMADSLIYGIKGFTSGK